VGHGHERTRLAAPVPDDPVSLLPPLGLGLALVAGLALGLSGLGHRWGWWGPGTAFTLLRGSAYAALGAGLVGLVALALALRERAGRQALLGVTALVLALAAVAVPWGFRRAASRVPPIHDLTTDLENPPRFVAVLARRAHAPNTAEHPGPVVAAQQRAAYPDLAPLRLAAPPARVFERAVAVARGLGWEIVATVPSEGRLEATDTTPWFGFKDDVVVRVAPSGAGTQVDVRSVSRVGRSDLGVNARRIRTFLDRLGAG
jgi:uncharacterized protein (DUF1499 family)